MCKLSPIRVNAYFKLTDSVRCQLGISKTVTKPKSIYLPNTFLPVHGPQYVQDRPDADLLALVDVDAVGVDLLSDGYVRNCDL